MMAGEYKRVLANCDRCAVIAIVVPTGRYDSMHRARGRINDEMSGYI